MSVEISVLDAAAAKAAISELADVLTDCVEGGASVNFVQPMTRTKADAWWAGALASHARGERLIFAATIADRLDGTVQLIPATQENQVFRADIGKMLVHRRARSLGVGTALLMAAEDEARRIGRTLLTLDTQTGGAGERLYARLGWTKFGEVPGYATSADGRSREAASFFYKNL